MRGGRWVIRWYRGDGSYSQATLATADDIFPADGAEIFDYAQAARRARDFVHEQRRNISAKVSGVFLTVRDAVEDYVAMRERREAAHEGQGGALKRDARSRLGKHVLQAKLASIPLHRLEDDELRSWRAGLPEKLAFGTVRRLTNDLKAALNAALEIHRKKLPAELALVIQREMA